MKTTVQMIRCTFPLLVVASLGIGAPALAQRPQDNWYMEHTWTKTGGSFGPTNGGLSSPHGVAIGPDGRIYVNDDSYGLIQVYLPDGTYSFSITNGFGGGQNFSQPRGMITDRTGHLFVADYGNNCVYQFTANGGYIRKFGSGTGSGNGELSGVIDVGVALNGDVYVLEDGNNRVSIFDPNGGFITSWGEFGTLDGQLVLPTSIAVAPNGLIYIAQISTPWSLSRQGVKIFTKTGVFVARWQGMSEIPCGLEISSASVRVDASGLIHIVCTPTRFFSVWNAGCSFAYDFIRKDDGTSLGKYRVGWDWSDVARVPDPAGNQPFPCHAVTLDGSVITVFHDGSKFSLLRRAFRDQWSPPRNAIPMPVVVAKQQRSSSPLVDIDYQVTDGDDTNVHVGMLIFTNSSSVAELGNCLRYPTLVEGTSTNLGAGISANQIHRLTWNAGADWSINLGNYRVAILARDSRTNLLDIHYLQLQAGNGMPALKISRSPLNTDDFMQVWWWQLAIGDSGILLTSNQIYGVSGTFTDKLLCTDGLTTADGRSYIYAKMHVREATVQEVQWAKQGNMPADSSPNQWGPSRSVGGRPQAVNEWGFDTGSWDTSTCKWVVPLN